MHFVIMDYGMGNLRSVQKAAEYLGYHPVIEREVKEIRRADGLILPGVGAFGDAMERLNETGASVALKEMARAGVPMLGICLGMQLLYEGGMENGYHDGLGLLEGKIVPFVGNFKIPHMGWNTIRSVKTGLTDRLGEAPAVYFIHSYYAPIGDATDSVCEYGGVEFSASAQKGNLYATQFHPEKSGDVGLRILERFFEEVGA